MFRKSTFLCIGMLIALLGNAQTSCQKSVHLNSVIQSLIERAQNLAPEQRHTLAQEILREYPLPFFHLSSSGQSCIVQLDVKPTCAAYQSTTGMFALYSRDTSTLTILADDYSCEFPITDPIDAMAWYSPERLWIKTGNEIHVLDVVDKSTLRRSHYEHAKIENAPNVHMSRNARGVLSQDLTDKEHTVFTLLCDCPDRNDGVESSFKLKHARAKVTCFANDGQFEGYALFGDQDGSLALINQEMPKMSYHIPAHRAAVVDCAVSADAKFIASAGEDNYVNVYRLNNGVEECIMSHEWDQPCLVRFNPRGNLLVIGTRTGQMIMVDLDTYFFVKYQPYTVPLIEVGFSDDGMELVAFAQSNDAVVHSMRNILNDIHDPLLMTAVIAYFNDPEKVLNSEKLLASVTAHKENPLIADYFRDIL